MAQFLAYLKSLDADTRTFVIDTMLNQQNTGAKADVGGGCNPACSGDGSTPNGYWVCRNDKCVWIPEIGIV